MSLSTILISINIHESVYLLCISGGTISLEDLSSFKASESDAWEMNLEEYDMYFPPPPAGGATLSFILNTMLGRKTN